MGKQIVEKIREAGVVGAGGAGLPTHVKADATVETVLVNGASCEPLLMSDPYLMEHEIDAVIQGLQTIMECTGAQKGIICLKGKHAEALATVRDAVASKGDARLSAFELQDFYPAGDEHVLVHEVLGKTVPERGIPLQIGAVVSNVESLFNITHAMHGRPVTHRYLTVAGEIANPMILKVPVGSIVSDILAFAGGACISDYRVVDGGPMMGRVLPDTSQPVGKTTSGLLVLPPDHNVVSGKTKDQERMRRISNTVCCQCSLCSDLCPRLLLGHRVHPHKIMRVHGSSEMTSPEAREALLCCECGICEKFACPMLISPREVNIQIKQRLMKAGITWDNSGHTPVSHPFRATRYVPTKRLMQRLDIVRYDSHPGYAGEFKPSVVEIPLKQHIGAPALPTVSTGDRVSAGDLIGEIPEKAMGARVHASIDGVVDAVNDGKIRIKAH